MIIKENNKHVSRLSSVVESVAFNHVIVGSIPTAIFIFFLKKNFGHKLVSVNHFLIGYLKKIWYNLVSVNFFLIGLKKGMNENSIHFLYVNYINKSTTTNTNRKGHSVREIMIIISK